MIATSSARKQLARIGYYRLKAYFLPFKNSDDHRIETNFNQIVAIYEFDRKMKNLLSLAIEEVEIRLRSCLSNCHALKYGADGYLDPANFSDKHEHVEFLSRFWGSVPKGNRSLIVQHHMKNFNGRFPLWAAVEFFSLSTLSKFYNDLKTEDKKLVAAQLHGTHRLYENIASWTKCCVDLRNTCAHYGRLYYRIFSSTPRNVVDVIPAEIKDRDPHALERLFAQILALKYLYPDTERWRNEVINPMRALVEQYGDSIDLQHIGFPSDWEDILRS